MSEFDCYKSAHKITISVMLNSNIQGAQRATYRSPEYNVPHLLPHLGFLIGPKNTNLVEDVEILLPIKFCQIQFSGFRAVLSQKCPLLTAFHQLYVRVISLSMQTYISRAKQRDLEKSAEQI